VDPDDDALLREHLVKHVGLPEPLVAHLRGARTGIGVLEHGVAPCRIEVGRPDDHRVHHEAVASCQLDELRLRQLELRV
jgi:hypothetical protein